MADDLFYIRRQKKEQRRREKLEKLEKKTQDKKRNSLFSIGAPTATVATATLATADASMEAHSSGDNALMAAAKRIERQRKLNESDAQKYSQKHSVASTLTEELQKNHVNSSTATSTCTFRSVSLADSVPDISLPRQQSAFSRRTVRWKGEASQEEEPLDLLALAKALAEKAHQTRFQQSDGSACSSLAQGQKEGQGQHKPEQAQESIPSCTHDLLETARRLEKKRIRETEEREERMRPRNPIALAKQEILDKDTHKVSLPTYAQSMNDRPSDASSSVRTTEVVSAQNDELWSDSEEDMDTDEPSEKQSAKSTNRKRTNIAPKPNQTRQTKRDSKETTKLGGGWRLLLSEGNTFDTHQKKESDEDAERKLFPQLEGAVFSLDKLEPFPLPTESIDAKQYTIPAALNRYLKAYQREGISFLYSAVIKGSGVILGDDMGLGKTVQLIGMLSALLEKTGTYKDLNIIERRRRTILKYLKDNQESGDRALLRGEKASAQMEVEHCEGVDISLWAPILIVVPSSLVENWTNEFKLWGHFSVAIFRGSDRCLALERVRTGMDEILICGKGLFDSSINSLNSVKWKLIVVDEFHEYKNGKTVAYNCVRKIKTSSKCPLVGLSGTVMQNKHKELWYLVDLVQPGLLGDWKAFDRHTSIPIKHSRTKTAKDDVLDLGRRRQQEFLEVLKSVYLRRDKKIVLKDDLKEKDELVCFCELTDVQKEIYEHLMEQPDFKLLRYSKTPCDCGVNRDFFLAYKKMKTQKERIDFQRRHKDEVVLRKQCCYTIPLNPRRQEPGQPHIDPKAVLWKCYHPGDQMCKNCPSCILLPAMTKLYKVCSHVSLLQVDRHFNSMKEGSAEWKKGKGNLDFAKLAFSPDVLARLPGKSYFRDDSIMDDHLALSGKMIALDRCLTQFYKQRDRVLVFSQSTATLDLIQHYVRSKGYSHLRLDGTTDTKKRQDLVNQYQSDESIFVFLITTKAGGLGLNLTSANKVCIFDVDWNPSYDEQAQDRAYRIGQQRDVDVIRFIARGSIEELKYIRQIYKVQLKNETFADGTDGNGHQQARIFRGVAGDNARKGELFGLENLIKYKDGSFMGDLWKSRDKVRNRTNTEVISEHMYRESDLASAMDGERVNQLMEGQKEDDFDVTEESTTVGTIGDSGKHETEDRNDSMDQVSHVRHTDFFHDDRGGAKLNQNDEGFEEEMGGETQAVHLACDLICNDEDNSESLATLDSAPVISTEKELPESHLNHYIKEQSNGREISGTARSERSEAEISTISRTFNMEEVIHASVAGSSVLKVKGENDLDDVTISNSTTQAGCSKSKEQSRFRSKHEGAEPREKHTTENNRVKSQSKEEGSPLLPQSQKPKDDATRDVVRKRSKQKPSSRFSASDIHVPCYKKRKKVGSKASRASGN